MHGWRHYKHWVLLLVAIGGLTLQPLTTVGYGDVTPLAPIACSLAWLEAMFGQFYVAVFIGQLIGLKLAHPTTVADE